MKTNIAALKIIKFSESLALKSYLVSANVWAIGWGTTIYPNGVKVRENEFTTPQLADSWLCHQVGKIGKQIEKSVNVELNENQFGALVSLIYNIGITKFNKSTLRKNLNAGKYQEASEQLYADLKLAESKKKNHSTVN